METFTIGQVVVVPFPFSDLSRAKMRPAIILADVGRDDWILCQVTSNPYGDVRSIAITAEDFQNGSLRITSYARPGKLFTANTGLMADAVGLLKQESFKIVLAAVIDMLQAGLIR
ncbi:MAG: hypothetical protein Fur0035_18950 [Anaerolineales bacterium]